MSKPVSIISSLSLSIPGSLLLSSTESGEILSSQYLTSSELIEKLLKSSLKKESQKGSFDKFVGILDKDFETDDLRYKEIVK